MSLDVTQIYDKDFFSNLGTEYVCTGFIYHNVEGSIIKGHTTMDNITAAHYHLYEMDEDGNGWATGLHIPDPNKTFGVYTTLQPEDITLAMAQGLDHKHKIVKGKVQWSKSAC